MNRREVIKLGSAVLGSLSLGAIAGYEVNSALNKDDKVSESVENKKFSIIPKQTASYEYSSPMPFNKNLIDKIYRLNQKMKKGQFKVLYSSLPDPLGASIHPLLHSIRGENQEIKSIEDYMEYVEYATQKGFKCVYVLNTTWPFSRNDETTTLKIVVPLFKKLYTAGIHDIKLANPNLMAFFTERLPEINMHLSTTSEYHSIQVYKNLINLYPNIKTINISTDDNHNFEFLSSLQKLLPDVKLEVLVNEITCIKNCPARFYHHCIQDSTFPCATIQKQHPSLFIARNNLVHPWQLEYYSATGINNFKFAAAGFERSYITNINYLKYYVDVVENGIEEYRANDLFGKIYPTKITLPNSKRKYKLSKLIEYLPDISRLIENGARCASDCGVNCRYCYSCAENIKKMFV